MKQLSAHSLGFTLIEIVIVITVMVIIGTGAIVNVVSFNLKQGTTDDAKILVTELRRAYAKATGVFYPQGCVNLTGYTVDITKDSQNMTVTANCTVPVPETRSNILKTSKFKAAYNFIFSVPDGALIPVVPNSAPVTLIIYNMNDATATRSVQLSGYGVFQVL